MITCASMKRMSWPLSIACSTTADFSVRQRLLYYSVLVFILLLFRCRLDRSCTEFYMFFSSIEPALCRATHQASTIIQQWPTPFQRVMLAKEQFWGWCFPASSNKPTESCESPKVSSWRTPVVFLETWGNPLVLSGNRVFSRRECRYLVAKLRVVMWVQISLALQF
mgnify:CR=1 FL=1